MIVPVLSSVLSPSFCRPLGTVPEIDQRLTLIHSEWSRRRDRELCDYWKLTMYQLQSLYNTRLSRTRCIMDSVWSPGIIWMSMIMRDILASFLRENTFCDQKSHCLKCAVCHERSELESWKTKTDFLLWLKSTLPKNGKRDKTASPLRELLPYHDGGVWVSTGDPISLSLGLQDKKNQENWF